MRLYPTFSFIALFAVTAAHAEGTPVDRFPSGDESWTETYASVEQKAPNCINADIDPAKLQKIVVEDKLSPTETPIGLPDE